MKLLFSSAFLLTLLLVACSDKAGRPASDHATADNDTIEYPATVKTDHTDSLHGTTVADPYRWLEDDVRENTDVAAWVEAQNATTFAYLDSIEERDLIEARLRELWNYERFGVPLKRGDWYFYEYNNGLQNQDVLLRQAGRDGEPEVVIDPNSWSGDGTVALAEWKPGPDGRYVASLTADGGSDWRVARVLDTATGSMLDDRLEWLKYTSVEWAADGSGFYYSRYPATAEDKFHALTTDQAVYFHRLGNPQSEDKLVYARPDHPDWGFQASVTDDGRFLVITIWKGTDSRYQVAVQDLSVAGSEPRMLIEGFDYDYTLVGNVGGTLLFRTTNAAPLGRLVGIDSDRPDPADWREIIPATGNVLESVSRVGDRLVAVYMQDAWSLVSIHDLDGRRLQDIDLPGIGTAEGFKGAASDPETFFSWSSFNTPTRIHRLDVATGKVDVFRQPVVAFDPDDYTVEQVFYASRDGTRVPMFITHRKDVVADGSNPTVLYGYGGFNVSLKPSFSVTRLAWMEMGGIWAVANLRGGGEYGEEWHKAGTRLDKQNVFDDFIAAAEYLVDHDYTNRDKLAIFGGSNGGLLVGAVTNQRPDLFAAAIPAVGVMDMLRFHHFTAGRFWVDDYGSAEDPDEFRALLAYSPYHNIRSGTEYPAVLVTTADTDDRVVPGHSFKYVAALQAAQAGDAPTLIRVETRAGHGAGTPTDKSIRTYADMWGFLVRNLDMQLPEGFGDTHDP